LFLVVHHSEVVVVTCAEHALRHHLILAFATLDRPEGSSAGLEPVTRYLPRLNNCERLRKAFLEDLRQILFLLIRQKVSPAKLLRDLPENSVFRWLASRRSSLVPHHAAI